MMALVRTELSKLTTIRTPWLLGIGAIAFVAASAIYTVAGAGRREAPSIGTTGLALNLLAGYGRGSLLAMVLGTLVVTTEYRHGTITSSLLRTPHRGRLAVAKALLVTVVSTAIGVLGLLTALALGAVAGAMPATLLSPDLTARGLGLLLTYPAYGLIGLGIGTMLPRYDGLAAILPAAWVLFLEDFVLTLFTRHVPEWALTRVSAAASNAFDVAPVLPVWAGVAALVGYAAAAFALGAVRLIRSDVP
jgi:ABC-2 type transport system permease protein